LNKHLIAVGLAITLTLMLFAMPSSSNTTLTMLAATDSDTANATDEAEPEQPPLKWPLKPATDKQVSEAHDCDLENLPAKRYPESTDIDDLADKFDAKTACDWAVLAVAYKNHVKEDDPAPIEGVEAFQQAVSMNSALAYRLPLLASYFGRRNLIEAPPFAQQDITRIKVEYSFSGIQSEPVQIALIIDKANTNKPVVTGTSGVDKPKKVSGTIDKDLIQALAPALTDLVPMQEQFTQQICYDDYPDWDVTLTFKDGSTMIMTNNESNIYFYGGPWQTEIKKQNYTQYSDNFLQGMLNILDALKLPKGETQGMYCYGVDQDPLTLAYPTEEPAATEAP
jgi:hypothetical protein